MNVRYQSTTSDYGKTVFILLIRHTTDRNLYRNNLVFASMKLKSNSSFPQITNFIPHLDHLDDFHTSYRNFYLFIKVSEE